MSREDLALLVQIAWLAFHFLFSSVDSQALAEATPPSVVKLDAPGGEIKVKDRTHERIRQGLSLRWPYSTEAFGTEGWRRHWIGKAPRVRAAVEDYTARFATPGYELQHVLCERHGITEVTLRNHIRALLINGLLRKIPPKEEAEG